ncbi:phosphomannose isomerase type II C-terminal cupin domain [Synechococcus sp. CS-1325]|uniref:phosphomannose isomerase type II C-terminal cupin domain n=1 Tax=unclassified Synechococcus TaxID=2626047 RepID=UPI000DB3179B|nr:MULTISPECIES: phosphomannose isomerase type II C-terminal cupin domain [unclassified Synechococcus]MCT0200255.1 phosphomannose isomerase type II C-terminal cupin domain [Synechococcus sp. CS-1325]MCT0214268.1 phosphomannose isomerase type II C-terminal cupin domain [Synechococcus sp. CS-1326]MCT0234432.1 phosphomannose isomerase type II C-terminal cupin domain [Synechococcus sp. CS-1327]PZV01611.1 MAG: mannose-6-phosphate isomerase [Cyanobium sp.]
MPPFEAERCERPWGWFECLVSGPGYQVKRLQLKAGQRISLQRHQQRSEHWVVIEGAGTLECDGQVIEAEQGTRLLIPLGAVHRATAGAIPLAILEVQIGSRLDEDDIERLADDYGRMASLR